MSGRLLPLPLTGAAGRLVRQLARLVSGPAEMIPIYPMLAVEGVLSTPWSSATFEGERHRLDLRLHGDSATIAAALDRLIALLPDAEFDLPGEIVAEARLVSMAVDPDPSVAALAIRIEFLTVVD